ncbi:MAG: DMT family transporter [Chloroflexi bacterium]|nr:DMT family transporter [Chloroflexota bacterium]
MGLGELSALLAAFTIAISGVLNKYLIRRMTPVSLNTTRTTAAAIFLVALFFAAGRAADAPFTDKGGLLLVVAGGLITTLLGDTLFLRLLKTVDVARTVTMAQAMLTLLMVGTGALILDEEVTFFTLVGALLVVLGIYLLGGPPRRKGPIEARWAGLRSIAFLLVVVLFWVTGLTLMREGLRDIDPITGNAARMVVIASSLLMALGFSHGSNLGAGVSSHAWARKMAQPNVSMTTAPGGDVERRPPTRSAEVRARGQGRSAYGRVIHLRGAHVDRSAILLGAISGSLSLGLGTTLMFFAFQKAGVAVTMVLFNAQLLLLAPLSMIVLKERLNPKSLVGILVTVGGIIIVLI